MKDTNSPTVTLNAVYSGQNPVRIDVNVKNAPPDLFGVSFYLRVMGPAWQLSKYDAGNVFSAPGSAPGFSPLILAQEKKAADGQKEIVFGISLRRTDKVTVHDGTLVSFYLKTDLAGKLRLDFTDAHLSILASQRVDLTNTVWEGKEFDLKSMAVASPSPQTGLQASVLQPAENPSLYAAEVSQFYAAMLMFVLVIALLTGIYFLVRRIKNFPK